MLRGQPRTLKARSFNVLAGAQYGLSWPQSCAIYLHLQYSLWQECIIHLCTVQLDNEFYVAVVNKSSDEVAKTLGSSFSAPQIAFLKTVVHILMLLCESCTHRLIMPK